MFSLQLPCQCLADKYKNTVLPQGQFFLLPIQFIPQKFQYLKVLKDMKLLRCLASKRRISQAKATRKTMFTVHFTVVCDNNVLYIKM